MPNQPTIIDELRNYDFCPDHDPGDSFPVAGQREYLCSEDERDELLAYIDALTAERDDWKTQFDLLRDDVKDYLIDIDRLTAERDELLKLVGKSPQPRQRRTPMNEWQPKIGEQVRVIGVKGPCKVLSGVVESCQKLQVVNQDSQLLIVDAHRLRPLAEAEGAGSSGLVSDTDRIEALERRIASLEKPARDAEVRFDIKLMVGDDGKEDNAEGQ